MNIIFFLSCLIILLGACDSRRRPVLVSMLIGIGFVLLSPLSGQWSYIQHMAVELSIIISLYATRSPWYYKALMISAFLLHLIGLITFKTGWLFYEFQPLYRLIMPCIYTLFLILTTKTEGALFSWWPPIEKKRKRWVAKERHNGVSR